MRPYAVALGLAGILAACGRPHAVIDPPAPEPEKPCDPLFNDCPEGEACVEGEGCQPIICTPDVDARCEDEDTVGVCNATGTGFEAYDCTAGRPCDPARPMVCVGPLSCAPGDVRCVDDTHTEVCDEQGQSWQPGPPCEPDALGRQCFDGGCRTQCEIAERTQSYIGCEYWGADLGNHFVESNDVFTFAFAVSNADPTLTADVQLRTESGVIDSMTVAPGELGLFAIPPPRPRNLAATEKRVAAYQILSTTPVAVYQFNPLETAEYDADGDAVRLAASTDASMLLPRHALDDRYMVVAWQQTPAPGPGFGIYTGGSLLAVAAAGQPVEVTLTPTAYSATGVGVSTATVPGQLHVFQLAPFEVLQLTTLLAGQDWTGSVIEATGPVAVFAGNECARVPANSNYCDHLEEQMFGLTAWGTTYVATKSWARGDEADVFRIIAEQDDTQVLFHPDSVSAPRTLARGQRLDITSQVDFIISSNKPILVSHFLTGSSTVVPGCDEYTCSETGDPSMILLPPVGQYRDTYVFLTPDTYQQDFVNIVLTGETELYLDDARVTDTPAQLGASDYSVLRLRVGDGPHHLRADRTFGLIVYGYGGNDANVLEYDTANVSYGYPGGLNLLPLNPKE